MTVQETDGANRRLRVLLVEDSETDAELIVQRLERIGYRVEAERVQTEEAMRAAFAGGDYDLVVSEYKLKSFDAATALRICRQEPDAAIPFIVLSGEIVEQQLIDLLKAGADDFVRKTNLLRIGQSIERALEDARTRREREGLQKSLEQSERNYRELAEVAPDPIWIHLDGRIVYVNAAALTLFGAERPEQLIGTSYLDRAHPDYREIARARVTQLLAGRQPPSRNHQLLLRLDGSAVEVEVASAPCRWNGMPAAQVVFRDLTEQRALETALRKSESRYRSLIENAPDGMFVHVGGRIVFANQAMVRLVGAPSLDKLLGRDPLSYIHPDCAALIERNRKTLAAGRNEGAIFNELRYLLSDGSTVDVESMVTRIEWSGQPATLVIVRDVTQRNRAQQALQESEERFRNMVGNIPGVVYQRLRHPDGRMEFPFMSDRVHELIGITAEQILAAPELLESHIHPDDRERYLRVGRASRERLEQIDAEYRLLRPDGTVVWVRSMSRPRRRDDGATVWDAIMHDITERKDAEAALHTSEEQLHNLANNVPGYIFQRRVGEDGLPYFPYISEGVENIAGVPAADVMRDSKTLLERIHPDDADALFASVREAAEKFSDWEALFRYVLEDGSIRWISTSARPRRLNDTDVVWDGMAIDATEAVRQAERNRQLEAQLRRSQRLESLGTLAGGIAHEINNLLHPMLMLSELSMMDLAAQDRCYQNLQRINESAQRAANIVSQILSFSRTDEAARQTVDLATVTEEALALLRPTLPATVEVRTGIERDGLTVRADNTQIHQVVLNLVANALHALAGKIGTLDVTARRVELAEPRASRFGHLDPGTYASIAIRDSGQGIPADALPRIFDPFFTTKDVGEGTGLGLSVVHGIIESHGGAIDVETEVGRGTIFTVYIPIVEAEPDAAAHEPARAAIRAVH